MIRLLSLLLMSLAVLMPTKLWAADGDEFTAETVEGVTMKFKVISEAGKTAKVWRPESNMWNAPVATDKSTEGTVTIPAEAKGYTITEICEDAFYYCEKITSVVIPNTVIRIADHAFNGCKMLSEVNLPYSLEEIGLAAFYGTAISTVFIP